LLAATGAGSIPILLLADGTAVVGEEAIDGYSTSASTRAGRRRTA
jgi:hypothetical protein